MIPSNQFWFGVFLGSVVSWIAFLIGVVFVTQPKHKCKELITQMEAAKARRDALAFSPWHWGTNPPAHSLQVVCFSPKYGRFVARYITDQFEYDPNGLPEDDVLIWCEMPRLDVPSEFTRR